MNHAARLSKIVALLSLVFLGATSATAVQSKGSAQMPTVAEILERNVRATGGRDALLRHKSMTIHGRYQAPSRNLDLETTTYTRDGKLLLKVNLPDGKPYLTGYDGKIAWDMDGSGKATIHDGDEAKSVARDADMYYHLHITKYFKSMDLVDIKDFNGRPCYHLKGVTNWDKVNEHFYDKETGLLQGYAFNTAWRGGNGDATETFEDYKDFGGVLMPAKTTSRDGNDLAVVLITSVTYDDVDDSVFALPDAVKQAATAQTRP
ncbi:MAG TPA: hypothetical protein VI636_21645 [Candidatus Angelobacter sp.]